jgi:hypothetical protein
MRFSWRRQTELPSDGYAGEYLAALNRTAALGLETPPRLLVEKDCVDPDKTMPVLLDYFDEHEPGELVGQTLAINVALIPRLLDQTGVPFNLTLGWIELDGKPRFQHGEERIRQFLREGMTAWRRDGVPFHVWLTSPAFEVLDVTFAMNNGLAQTQEECARLIIYKSMYGSTDDPIYHPTVVGEESLSQTEVLLDLGR